MKRLVITMVCLLALVSAVTAVSAYEAHFVNVKAHVENALVVSPDKIEFGTVFPEEWLTKDFQIALSPSFVAQDRWRCVHFFIYAQRKPNDTGGQYPWMGDFTYLCFKPPAGWKATQAGAELVGADPGPTGVRGPIIDDNVPLGVPGINNTSSVYFSPETIGVGIDVPVFSGFYNPATDVKPKPSGLEAPTLVIPKDDTTRWTGQSFDCGLDLIIQVTGFCNWDGGGQNPW